MVLLLLIHVKLVNIEIRNVGVSMLYNMDCFELLKEIKDKSVDLVLTDPPYLMQYKTNHRKNKKHEFCTEITGDKDFDIDRYLKECHRILKDDTGIYVFCNSNKVDIFKIAFEKYFKLKNIIVWVKNNWTAGDLKGAFGKQYELILYGNKGRKLINGKRITDVWKFDRVVGKNQLHQNQKPLDLLELCLEKSSNKNDLVFDGCFGSGSTAVACHKLKREFIGSEINKEYFQIAIKRLIDRSAGA